MIVVDTSVWVDYFNGLASPHTDLLDDLLGREPVVMGDIILTEVLQGFARDKEFAQARRMLDKLPFRNMIGREIAIKSAENYRLLRSRGVTVRKTIDVMIGTFCIENDLPLLHNDRDFHPLSEHLGLISII